MGFNLAFKGLMKHKHTSKHVLYVAVKSIAINTARRMMRHPARNKQFWERMGANY